MKAPERFIALVELTDLTVKQQRESPSHLCVLELGHELQSIGDLSRRVRKLVLLAWGQGLELSPSFMQCLDSDGSVAHTRSSPCPQAWSC